MQQALKRNVQEQPYQECSDKKADRDRLAFWIQQGGTYSQISAGTRREERLIREYARTGDADQKLISAIHTWLIDNEHPHIPYLNPEFCLTTIAKQILRVCAFSKEAPDMGLVITPSGIGKTTTIQQYSRERRDVNVVTCSPVTRRNTAVLQETARALKINLYDVTNQIKLMRIINELKGSHRLLIFDEAHHLQWESIELVRSLFDASGVGVVFCGQESLLNQMQGGSRAMLYDQIYSRIGSFYRFRGEVCLEDVELVASNICGNLDKKSINFLHSKANKSGRLRRIVKVLKQAKVILKMAGEPITVELLKELDALQID